MLFGAGNPQLKANHRLPSEQTLLRVFVGYARTASRVIARA
jgi:hypothetical protein